MHIKINPSSSSVGLIIGDVIKKVMMGDVIVTGCAIKFVRKLNMPGKNRNNKAVSKK